ncbi:MAG: FtsX-like permease family protein [Anaerolineaceae bacterium]|nr:FtsX-like permease family protein [Anaerolineaceae bacterium]
MVIAIDVANSSASRAFSLSTESITGKATHQIIGGPLGLPTDLYRQLRQALDLREVAPVVEATVRAASLGEQPLHLLGVDSFAEPPFRSYLTTVTVLGENQGAFDALNAFIAEPDTVLISRTLAARFGIQPGDVVTLRAGERLAEVRIVGLLQPDDPVSEQALDNLMLTDIATAQEVVGNPGTISRIDLILPPDYDTSRIENLLPPGALLTTPQAENGALAQMTDAFELNLQALSLLALVVGVFLIYNTVTFSVVQRRPVIGILRSLGTTQEQIFALVLGEALLLGIIGTIFGLALGVIFGRGAVGLVSQTISDLYFTVNVQGVTVLPGTLVKGALVGLAASVFAAVIPAFDATRTPPAGVLRRSEVEQKARQLLPVMTAVGLGMNLVGGLLLTIPNAGLIVSFIALFCIVVGGALFTPLALVGMMRLVTPLTERVFGVLGRMAPRAVVRSLSRTSIAVAALTVAISVIVGVSVMIGSFRSTVSDWLQTTLGADVYISPPQLTSNTARADVDPALAQLVAAVPGVDQVATIRSVQVTAPDYPDLPPVNLAVPNMDISTHQRRFAWLHAPDGDYWTAMVGGAVVVSEPFAFRRSITEENNTLTLLTDQGAHTFTVAGVFYDYSTDQGTVLMADSVYRTFYDDPYITSLGLFLKPGVSPESVVDTLQTATLVGYDLQVQSYATLRNGVFAVFDRAFSITVALQVLATVVAFIGILSALLALQLEHTRQYGVMRAVGMIPGQLWRFTLIQTGLMGVTAGLLALPIGFVMSLVLIYVINVRSFGWTMALALGPSEFASAFLVAVVAALVAGVYPAWRLGRLVTAEALRSE